MTLHRLGIPVKVEYAYAFSKYFELFDIKKEVEMLDEDNILHIVSLDKDDRIIYVRYLKEETWAFTGKTLIAIKPRMRLFITFNIFFQNVEIDVTKKYPESIYDVSSIYFHILVYKGVKYEWYSNTYHNNMYQKFDYFKNKYTKGEYKELSDANFLNTQNFVDLRTG